MLASLLLVVLAGACGGSVSLAQTQSPPPAPGLPQAGDLSFAELAGTTVIGLTLRPPQPGPNTVYLYVVPIGGPAAAADVNVTLSVDGQAVPLTFCSRSCRTADLDLAGGEQLEVDVTDGPSTSSASFQMPVLPVADGADLLSRMQARMHALQSYSIDETLGPGDPPTHTHYTAVSPNELAVNASNGYQLVWIGSTRYSRSDPGQPWDVADLGVTVPVPGFIWDPSPSSQVVSPMLFGSDTLDGKDTQVVAFYMQLGQSPFWFRVWVDSTGRVLQAQMRGQGHFMDQRFSDFDAPLTIAPPT